MATLKKCSVCKVEKPATTEYFFKQSGTKSGLNSRCRVCDSEIRRKRYAEDAEHRATINQRNRVFGREYRSKNPEAYRAKNRNKAKKIYDANPEKYREKSKLWRRNNLEKAKEMRKKLYLKNERPKIEADENYREQLRVAKRAYKRRNPMKAIVYKQNRRAKLLGLPHTFTVKDADFALDYFNHTCPVCENPLISGDFDFDHWIAVASDLCPGTIPDNMLPLCSNCNQSKGAKLPFEWLTWRYCHEKATQIFQKIETFLSSRRG